MHTSIINVMLIETPEKEEVSIDKSKVTISYYKDSGAGGQHRNKTMSGVRLQYEGYLVECCDGRDQRRNKEIAFQRLEEKIREDQERQRNQQISAQYQDQNPNKGKRGDYERNYNYKRNEVVQNGMIIKLNKFLKGNFQGLY